MKILYSLISFVIALCILGVLRIGTTSQIATGILFVIACMSSSQVFRKFGASAGVSIALAMSAILVSLSFVLAPIGLLSTLPLSITLAALSLIAIWKYGLEGFQVKPNYSMIIVVVAGILLAMAYRHFAPFPLETDDDTLQDFIRINFIANNGSAPVLLIGGLRPVLFASVYATLEVFSGLGLNFAWYASFFLYPLWGVSVYYLARKFLRPEGTAVIASLFFLLMCGFWGSGGPETLRPDTLSIIIGLFCIALFVESKPSNPKSLVAFTAFFAYMTFGYYYSFIAFLPIIALLLVENQSIRKSLRNLAVVSSGLLLIASLVIYSKTIGSLQTVLPNFQYVTNFLVVSYGYAILVLIALGFLIIYIKHNTTVFLCMAYVAFLFCLSISPITEGFRLEIFLRPFAAIIATYALVSILSLLNVRKVMAIAFVTICILSPLLVQPYYSWFNDTVQLNVPRSNWYGLPMDVISSDEGNAGLWLRSQPNGFLITDIFSERTFQSLTFNSGVYNPITFLNYTLLIEVYQVLASRSQTEFSGALNVLNQSVKASTYYLVVDTRLQSSLSGWYTTFPTMTAPYTSSSLSSLGEAVVVNYPQKVSTLTTYQFLSNYIVYSNPTVTIYRL